MSFDEGVTQQQVGETLGRYRLLQKIGRGGMSDVWLCEDPRLRRKVAVKTLPLHDHSDREFTARFIREARAAGALNHPHILPIHDYGEQQLTSGAVITFIVMPYIAGGSLADRLDQSSSRRGRLPQREMLTYLSQAAEAIDYAHTRGIIHRDIKPANMLLRDDNWLLLADFGIARMLTDTDHLTQTGDSIGTPDYMAPEQARGQAEFASDTYSLAVIAYQLLSGSLPFSGDSSYTITLKHMTEQAPSPRQFNPRLPQASVEVLLHALAKNPADRFASASAFMNALRQSLEITGEEETYIEPDNIETQGPQGPLARSTESIQTEISPTTDAESVRTKPVVTRRAVLIGSGVAAATVVGAAVVGYSKYKPMTQPARPTIAVRPTVQANPKVGPDDPAFILREHNQPVTTLAWSPKSNVLASAANDDFVKLWNFADVQPHTTLKSSVTHTFSYDTNRILSWSPDGTMLAIANAGTKLDFDNNYIQIYKSDLSAPASGFTTPLRVSGIASSVGWLQQGKYFFATSFPLGSKNTQLALWDMTQPQLQLRAAALPGFLESDSYNQDLSSCAIVSPDGMLLTLALSGTRNTIVSGQPTISGDQVQWQTNGKTLQFGADDNYDITALSYSPDGKYIAATDNGQPTTLQCWRVSDGSTQTNAFSVSGQTQLTAMAWCPKADSTLVAAASLNGPIYIWDRKQGANPIRTLHNANITDRAPLLTWSADGQWLAAGYQDNEDSILVWHV